MSQPRHEHSGRCERLLEELMAYVDGELTPERCRAVERHLAKCECCGTVADNVRAVVALCRSDRKTPLPASLRARARARIRALLATASGRVAGTRSAQAAVPAAAATPASGATRGSARARDEGRRAPSPRSGEARPATRDGGGRRSRR